MELNEPITLTYNILSEEDKTVEVVFNPSYLELKDIVIPNKVTDSSTGMEYTVKAIGKMAFDDCPEIRSVIMGDSITRIEDYAFNMCENKVLHKIGYVKFSKNLTHIGNYAFRNCHNLTTGHFTEGYQYKLKVLDFIENVDYPVYGYAGRLTGLDNYLLLPESVNYIGKHAFEGCYFEKEGSNMNYGLCKVKIPNPSCVIDDYAFAGCRFLELITIGEELNYDGLKVPNPATTKKGRIGDYAFANCNLMRLDIPSSIESIGKNAFINCFNKVRAHTPRVDEGRIYFDDLNWFYPRSLFNNETGQWNNWNFHRSDDKSYIQLYDTYLERWHTNTVTIHSDKTTIGANAFADNALLEKVIINNSTGEIGAGAFRNCTNLKSIELPAGLTMIDQSTFMNCAVLDTVKIPETVIEIGDSAFYQCKRLHLIELPSLITKVNPYTFYGCEWLELSSIPAGVRSIGNHAFYGCKKLNSFNIPDGVTSIGDYAFAECFEHSYRIVPNGLAWNYGMTQFTIGNGVVSIGAHAFDGCRHLGQINFGNSVKTIGDYAFRNCMSCPEEDHNPEMYTAADIELPATVTSIGTGAFQGCSHLPTIALSEGMTELPDSAFAYCNNLSAVTNYSSIGTISTTAFLGCYNLENLGAFYPDEGLKDGIYYSEDGTEVLSALANIEEANIADGVTRIRDGAFAECGALSSINFPETLEYIGSHAFENCISLPSAVLFNVEMGDSVYAGCTGIEQVDISADFDKNINDNWFAGCINMLAIEVQDGNPRYSSDSGMLLDATGETLLRAPSGIGLDGDEIIIPSTVTKIGEYAFSNCIRMTWLMIPETVAHIGAHAFDGCYSTYMWGNSEYYEGLESIELYNPAVTIGEYAFNNCKNLNAIYWDESLSGDIIDSANKGSIGAYAFNGCESLDLGINGYTNFYSAVIGTLEPYALANCEINEEIELPQTLESIGDHAFENCRTLTSVVFPEGLKKIGNSAFISAGIKYLELPDAVEEIGDSAFMNCSDLMDLKLPSSLKEIRPYTFYNCFSGLFDDEPQEHFNLSIEIPNGVKSIGDYAFYGGAVYTNRYYGESNHNPYSTSVHHYFQYGLSSVTIGENVETIGAHAFDGCTHLLEVKMGDAVTSIGDYAFNNCFKELFNGVRAVQYTLTGIIEQELGTVWELTEYTPQPIVLPDGLESLGEGSFNGCAELPSINIPGLLTAIPDHAFNGCMKLPEINLPEGIRSIGETAFGGCTGVEKISIPASLEKGSRSFVDCDKALNVYYYAEEPKTFDEGFFSPRVYSSNQSVIYAKNAPLDSLKGRTPWAHFYRIVAKDETLVHLERALETKNGLRFRILSNKPNPYCEVAGPASEATDTISYIVPDYVVNTDETSDYYGKQYKVIRIGNDAFENDLTLVGIHIPEGVVEIGQEAFSGCKNLPKITLPGTITNIGERAFANCYALTYFEVPPLVTRMSPGVLKDCRGLNSIAMHDNIEELGIESLMDCRHLRAFERSENWKLRLIDDYALKNCIELEKINIPEGVEKIGKEAMYYCQKLQIVSLPKSLLEIGENVFDDCEVLSTIKIYTEDTPKIRGEANLTEPNCKIYVQAKCLDDYRELWKVHAHRIEPGIIIAQPTRKEMPEYTPGNTHMIISNRPLDNQKMTWSCNNPVVASPDPQHDGTILLNAVGHSSIHVETDERYYHDCELDVYPKRADANWDGKLDIADAVNIATFALQNPEGLVNWYGTNRTDLAEGDWHYFYGFSSDLNDDSSISISDASAAVKLVLDNSASGVAPKKVADKHGAPQEPVDAIIVGSPINNTLLIGLDNSKEYVALEANIRVAEGATLDGVSLGTRAANHTLSTRRIDDRTMRIVLFDFNCTPFASGTDALLELTVGGRSFRAEDVEIFNVAAADASSVSHGLDSKTGIVMSGIKDVNSAMEASVISTSEGVEITGAQGQTITVYAVDGALISTIASAAEFETIPLNHGIYIVTINGHSVKVVIK